MGVEMGELRAPMIAGEAIGDVMGEFNGDNMLAGVGVFVMLIDALGVGVNVGCVAVIMAVAVLLGIISVGVGDGVSVGGTGVGVLVSVAVGMTTVLVGVSVAVGIRVGMAVMVGKNWPMAFGNVTVAGANGLLNQITAAMMPKINELSNKRVPSFCDCLRME